MNRRMAVSLNKPLERPNQRPPSIRTGNILLKDAFL